jgi:sulfofructose kinase
MAATAAAAIAALGGNVEVWGRVGDDEIGRNAIEAFNLRGVSTKVKKTHNAQSPISAVIVDGAGERMLAVYPGRLESSADWLELDLLKDISAVHADFRWVEGAKKLFLAAKSLNIPRVLDADAGDIAALKELVPLANHVIFSERGLALFTEGLELGEGLRFASQFTDGVIGVTLGDKGSLFLDNDKIHEFLAPKIIPIDTNGAGDVFHGAYALALGRGITWMDAARYASAAATLRCSKVGGWQQLPTHSEVMHLLGNSSC